MTGVKVTMLMDSIAERLNMKQKEEEKKNSMPDQRPIQTTAAIHITMRGEHRITHKYATTKQHLHIFTLVDTVFASL